MKNCKVTTLKGAVDNSNIDKLGQYSFEFQGFPSETSGTLNFKIIGSKVIFDKDVYINDMLTAAGTEITFTSSNTFKPSVEGTYKCTILDKYNATKVQIYNNNFLHFDYFPVEDLRSFKKLVTIACAIDGSITELSTTVKNLEDRLDTGQESKIQFKGADFSHFTHLESFVGGGSDNNVHGINITTAKEFWIGDLPLASITDEDILNIAKNIGITSVLFPALDFSKLSLFADEQVRLGRTSGSLSFFRAGMPQKTITYNSSLPDGYSIS